ncbi:DUF397 domain-containing protein [Streptomyces sp. MAA16]|uniref:DUF397 domain-containing protein n=1 Tax=Streptomyces sp. MAA16 TaxID=3035116 RepID=UPI0024743031|nr:DUF397 domain-containing protein [Streptomyces sp. MAA16]MDH6703133.1 hypothetical protein [Streptomyces sp. MAA16]
MGGSVLVWFKSTYSSSGDGNDCVEVAVAVRVVRVRDSKNIGGPQLVVAGDVWGGFVAGL